MIFKREIEKKYIVKGMSIETVVDKLQGLFTGVNVQQDTAYNVYWSNQNVDFVRLRENPLELTVKRTDKNTIEDRIEENLPVEDFEDARRWATVVFGEPTGAFRNNYYIFQTELWTVSVYQVEGRSEVIVEVESDNMLTVEEVAWVVNSRINMTQEFRSLYQIVFGEDA